jgi:hypothetical protein
VHLCQPERRDCRHDHFPEAVSGERGRVHRHNQHSWVNHLEAHTLRVASTKAYTSQFVSMVIFALHLSQDTHSTAERRAEIIGGLKRLPSDIAKMLEDEQGLKMIAEQKIKNLSSLLLFGRGYQLATCFEGALKIEEISYIHSEGIGSGELKHGPLALVDKDTGIIMIMTDDGERGKTQNAFEQVRSRRKPHCYMQPRVRKHSRERSPDRAPKDRRLPPGNPERGCAAAALVPRRHCARVQRGPAKKPGEVCRRRINTDGEIDLENTPGPRLALLPLFRRLDYCFLS